MSKEHQIVLAEHPEIAKILNEKNLVLVDADKLKKLIELLQEKTADEKELKECVLKIMGILGVIDEKTGKIKPEIASGEESFIPGLFKSIGSIMSLFMKAQAPAFMGGKEAEEEIKTKFSFISKIIPIITKHGN